MTDVAAQPSAPHPASAPSGWQGQAAAAFLTQLVEKGTLRPTRALLPSADLTDEGLALARLGFRVTVVDPRPTALHALESAAREARVRLDLFRSDYFRDPPSLYGPIELIVDRTLYHSLPPGERAEWAHRAGRILPSGGRLVGLFLIGRQHGGPPYPVSLADLRRSLARLFNAELLDPVGAAEPGHPLPYRGLFRRH